MYRKLHPACSGVDRCVKSSVPAHLDVHPLHDYEPVGRSGDFWVGLHREKSSRRMAYVQQVISPRLDDLQRLSQVAHRNLARPMALYFLREEAYIAWEYVDLDVLDLPPVSVTETAAIMAQMLEAVHFLVQNQIGFRILSSRILPDGTVKLVLDWNFEAKVDYSIMNANHEYVAAYLADLFGRLWPLAHVDVDATAFGNALETGSLPLTSVRPNVQLDLYLGADMSTASVHRQVQRTGHPKECVRIRRPETYGVRASLPDGLKVMELPDVDGRKCIVPSSKDDDHNRDESPAEGDGQSPVPSIVHIRLV